MLLANRRFCGLQICSNGVMCLNRLVYLMVIMGNSGGNMLDDRLRFRMRRHEL